MATESKDLCHGSKNIKRQFAKVSKTPFVCVCSPSPGWYVGESPDLSGHLRLLGCSAPPGSPHPGPGLLLGLHEGQPAPPELHIDLLPARPDPTRTLPPTPRQTGGEKAFKKREKIYLFNFNPRKKEKFSSSPSLFF